MPLLKEENPKLAQNLSAMALRLRLDEQALAKQASFDEPPQVDALRQMSPAVRARALEQFLKQCGVKEPEAVHIRQAEALVFSENPSARALFPGGITVARNYGMLEQLMLPESFSCDFTCSEAAEICNAPHIFTVHPVGRIFVRCRQSGDAIRLSGGTRSLKKLFIDRKIPAARRGSVPILCDEAGILGIPGIGVNLDRAATALPATRIEFNL
jgi:tRNA(Ile)-lysidine synthase